MITKRSTAPARKPITAGQSITSGVRNRNASAIKSSVNLTPSQRMFANQLARNCRKPGAIMAATNTSNIMARPDFLDLLPVFVQKLIVTDIFGSVAMRSRQQLVPYFKFIAENTKGETKAGTVMSSPFANRQGVDPNFTGRVVKNEEVDGQLMYTPVLPGTVTIKSAQGVFVDKGDGKLYKADTQAESGTIDYATGEIGTLTGDMTATYQYDNETVGPDTNGQYGAKMGKGYLQLDEFNLVAEAKELACYWSVYSAFAAQQEYGSNIADMAKEAAIGEITAEINTACLDMLMQAASYKPAFNWDASPVLSGAVVPSDYLNMFKLKLGQAAASIYQQTRMTRPNRLVVGTTAAEYIGMINGFKGDNIDDTVGPYKFGTLDQFEIYVNPSYDPDSWVMCCKSNDIRKNTALFGEYMPITNTDVVGLANMSAQQGYATMYASKVVNPATCVKGKILGTF